MKTDEYSRLKKEVLAYIETNKLFHEEDRVVVALSGGIDSVALVSLLCELNQENRLTVSLYPMYVHHGLRDDADDDIVVCKALCESLGLSLHVEWVKVNDYVNKHQVSVEDAARQLRYAALADYSKSVSGTVIAVAHHKEDQAETVLHRMIRGAGTKGLGGMAPKVNNIVRPLLQTRKETLTGYVKSRGLSFVTDSTNFENIYTRNRIRHDLIPMLKNQFNENIVENLVTLSELFREEEEYLQSLTEKNFQEVCSEQWEGYASIDAAILDYPRALSRRLIRKAIEVVKGDLLDIQFHHIENILGMKELQSGRVVHIHKTVYVKKEYDKLVFYKPTTEKTTGFSYTLDTQVNKGYIQEVKLAFSVKILDYEQFVNYKDSFKNTEKVYTKCFDYDKIKANLVLRSRRLGDIIHIHSDGRKKSIKKFFIDEKVPGSRRDNIPLLADGNNVLWIVGYRTNPLYEVNQLSKSIVVVELFKEDKNGSKD